MIDSDEARKRGLGFFRGLVFVLLFYAVAAFVVVMIGWAVARW